MADKPTKGSSQVLVLAANSSPQSGRIRTRLDTSGGILREMSRVYRAARSGSMPVEVATRLVFILDRMARVVADVTFEQRLAALERRHGNERATGTARAA